MFQKYNYYRGNADEMISYLKGLGATEVIVESTSAQFGDAMPDILNVCRRTVTELSDLKVYPCLCSDTVVQSWPSTVSGAEAQPT